MPAGDEAGSLPAAQQAVHLRPPRDLPDGGGPAQAGQHAPQDRVVPPARGGHGGHPGQGQHTGTRGPSWLHSGHCQVQTMNQQTETDILSQCCGLWLLWKQSSFRKMFCIKIRDKCRYYPESQARSCWLY